MHLANGNEQYAPKSRKAQKQKNGTCICIFKPIYFHTACLCTKTNVPSINMMIKIKRHNFKGIKQIRNEILVSDFLPTYSERIKTGIIHSSKFLTCQGLLRQQQFSGFFFTFHLIYFRADHRDIAIELMPFSSLSVLSVV